MLQRAGFSGKKIYAQKFVKMDQKWPEKWVFKIYQKIRSLIFAEFVL